MKYPNPYLTGRDATVLNAYINGATKPGEAKLMSNMPHATTFAMTDKLVRLGYLIKEGKQYKYTDKEIRVPSIVDVFWERVNKTETCWEWIHRLTTNGYGVLSVDNDEVFTHRFSWDLHNGKIPTGQYVLHKCDNRKCVNPSHLFLGTLNDNNQDMFNKNRHVYGETHVHSKLTDHKVRTAKKLIELGFAKSVVAEMMGVSRSTLRTAISGKTWKHLKE